MAIGHSFFARIGSVCMLAMISMVVSCAVPGRLYLVAPEVTGALRSAEVSFESAELRLKISHREGLKLHDAKKVALSMDGRFSFEPLKLAIAGHEYSKNYRAFLHLLINGKDRVIWRAQFSRRALTSSIQLDCDLERPMRHGQPCWVTDPLEQAWLIEEGERTFERLCISCHGVAGTGVASLSDSSDRRPADLRRIAIRRNGRFDRAEIAEWIEGRVSTKAHGTRSMPIWGERLSTEYERYPDGGELIGATLDPLVIYLESLQITESSR